MLLQGAGLVERPRRGRPAALHRARLALVRRPRRARRRPSAGGSSLACADAGGGAGTWRSRCAPSRRTPGAPRSTSRPRRGRAGRQSRVPVVAVRADANAAAGDNYGFLVLRRGDVTRRIPYLFLVTRPRLAASLRGRSAASPGRRRRATGESHASVYRFPTAPFGTAADLRRRRRWARTAPSGSTSSDFERPVANFGVAVVGVRAGRADRPRGSSARQDENDVQGYAGTPVNVNALMLDYRLDLGAAGAVFPRQKRLLRLRRLRPRPVHRQAASPGRYVLRSWVNDVRRPASGCSRREWPAAGRLVVARAIDRGAGVDPFSLAARLPAASCSSAAAYDPGSGLALFSLPPEAPAARRGTNGASLVASDYQETKNVNTPRRRRHAEHAASATGRLRRDQRPVVTWLPPGRTVRGPLGAAARRRQLHAAASARPASRRREADPPLRQRRGAGLYAHLATARPRARPARPARRRPRREGAHGAATRIVRGCRRAR